MDLLEVLGISPPAADSALCCEIYDDRYVQGNKTHPAACSDRIKHVTSSNSSSMHQWVRRVAHVSHTCFPYGYAQVHLMEPWKRYASSACSCCPNIWRVTSGSMNRSGCRAAADSCHHGWQRREVRHCVLVKLWLRYALVTGLVLHGVSKR
jgi:hypothetical protein